MSVYGTRRPRELDSSSSPAYTTEQLSALSPSSRGAMRSNHIEVFGTKRRGRFDLYCGEGNGPLFDDDVDFVFIGIAPERKMRRPPAIEILLHEFRHDRSLEHGPSLGVHRKLIGIFYSKKVAQQPAVVKIELGRFHEPFSRLVA